MESARMIIRGVRLMIDGYEIIREMLGNGEIVKEIPPATHAGILSAMRHMKVSIELLGETITDKKEESIDADDSDTVTG